MNVDVTKLVSDSTTRSRTHEECTWFLRTSGDFSQALGLSKVPFKRTILIFLHIFSRLLDLLANPKEEAWIGLFGSFPSNTAARRSCNSWPLGEEGSRFPKRLDRKPKNVVGGRDHGCFGLRFFKTSFPGG